MTDAQSLLNLPAETLTVLVAGYLGYRLAYLGKDETHRAADVVFRSLVFGLVAQMVLRAGHGLPALTSQALAVLAALAAAAIWRKWGMKISFEALRKARISASDGHPTALQSVVQDDGMKLSQILVRRKNGSELLCNDYARFEATRTGPCYFGPDGSIALYVTDFRGPDEDAWAETEDVFGAERGNLITIIPADEIAMIKLRVK